MKILLLIPCFCILIACKSDKKNVDRIEKESINFIVNNKANKNSYFEVVLNVLVKENDKFHLFYKDFNDKNYSPDRVIEKVVKGKAISQKIIFSLPKGIIPNAFRIDFGINYAQKPIMLNDLILRYEGKEFHFDDGRFEQLFRPNKFVSYDINNKLITTTPRNGEYDPNFISINLEEITFSLVD